MSCSSRRRWRSLPPLSAEISSPSKLTAPLVGRSRATTSRPIVVLPQPDSPTSPKVSPRRTEKETSDTALTVPIERCSTAPAVTSYSFSTWSSCNTTWPGSSPAELAGPGPAHAGAATAGRGTPPAAGAAAGRARSPRPRLAPPASLPPAAFGIRAGSRRRDRSGCLLRWNDSRSERVAATGWKQANRCSSGRDRRRGPGSGAPSSAGTSTLGSARSGDSSGSASAHSSVA